MDSAFPNYLLCCAEQFATDRVEPNEFPIEDILVQLPSSEVGPLFKSYDDFLGSYREFRHAQRSAETIRSAHLTAKAVYRDHARKIPLATAKFNSRVFGLAVGYIAIAVLTKGACVTRWSLIAGLVAVLALNLESLLLELHQALMRSQRRPDISDYLIAKQTTCKANLNQNQFRQKFVNALLHVRSQIATTELPCN